MALISVGTPTVIDVVRPSATVFVRVRVADWPTVSVKSSSECCSVGVSLSAQLINA